VFAKDFSWRWSEELVEALRSADRQLAVEGRAKT